MNLDRQIELLEPGPETISDVGGREYGDPTVHRVYAHKSARAGSTGIIYSTTYVYEPTRYTIRYAGFSHMTVKWGLVDEGKEHKIESIYEPRGTRRQWLVIEVR